MDLLQELEQFEAAQPQDKPKAHGIQKVRYTHDAMIDLIIAYPDTYQSELAKRFGYTQGWVSRVLWSDAFQARLAARKAEIIDPQIIQSFEERIKGLANQSLSIIEEKLEATRNPDLALRALQLSTTALGMGARERNVQQVNNYVVALPAKVADEHEWAAGAISQVRAAKRDLQDVPLVEDVTPKVG